MQTEQASQENSKFVGEKGWALALTPAQLLWAGGKDALSFLQGMCTQQLNTLRGGQGVWSLFLNRTGGLVTTARIWKAPEFVPGFDCLAEPDYFLVVLPPEQQAPMLGHLKKHVVSEDVELRPELSSLYVLELAGPMAYEGLSSLTAMAQERREFLLRLPGSLGGLALLVSKRLGEQLPTEFPSLEEAQWEALRMEYGRAAWGKELEAGCLASEFRLEWAIHYAKGCYVGQEAIARTTFRTLPRKRLGAFVHEGALLPRGTPLWQEGKEVGQVLSSALSPALGSALAMAHVLWGCAEPGQTLSTAGGQKLQAVELPLWKEATA